MTMREELLALGRRTAWEPFLEQHHVEPERVEIINLTQLQHLAIHICECKIHDNNRNRAAVTAFVRAFPGGWRRIVKLQDPELTKKIISYGQGRPENDTSIPARASGDLPRTEKQLKASAETGKRTISIAQEARRNTPNTWGWKVSESRKNKPMCSCIICRKEMKAFLSNIIQHQRSSKCNPVC